MMNMLNLKAKEPALMLSHPIQSVLQLLDVEGILVVRSIISKKQRRMS